MRVLCLLFSMVLSFKTYGQEIVIYGGLSTPSMKDLRSLQTYARLSWPVNVKAYGSFSPFWQQGVGINFPISSKMKVGLHVFSTSTGGRNFYEDYSGRIQEDFTARCVGLMGHFEYNWGYKKSSFGVYSELGLVRSRVKYLLDYRLGNDSYIETETLRSLNLAHELGGTWSKEMLPQLYFEARFGFHINMTGDLKTEDDYYLTNPYSNSEVKCDWSGIKLLVGIVFKSKSKLIEK